MVKAALLMRKFILRSFDLVLGVSLNAKNDLKLAFGTEGKKYEFSDILPFKSASGIERLLAPLIRFGHKSDSRKIPHDGFQYSKNRSTIFGISIGAYIQCS